MTVEDTKQREADKNITIQFSTQLQTKNKRQKKPISFSSESVFPLETFQPNEWKWSVYNWERWLKGKPKIYLIAF